MFKVLAGCEHVEIQEEWRLLREGTEALLPVPTLCPMRLFYLAVPDLRHFTTNR